MKVYRDPTPGRNHQREHKVSLMAKSRSPLHELSALFLQVWDNIDENLGDDGSIPFDLKLCLDAVEGDLKDRWEELAKIVAAYENQAEECSNEAKRLKERSAAAEKKAARIKGYILDSMNVAGFKKHQGKLYTLTVKNNPPSVQILDEGIIPDEFCEIRMNQFISKTAIAARIKEVVAELGEDAAADAVPGAVSVSSQQLQIR